MKYDRKAFLKTLGLAGGGLVINSFAGTRLLAEDILAEKKLSQFGIQLYTLRADLPKDPKGILKQLAGFGYKQIESYEGAQGMFWGMGPAEFKQYIGDLGMTIVSSHCDIKKDFEKKAADAASIGMKYLICPYLGAQKSLDDYKRFADQFNECGAICKKHGLRFAYHNHAYSFTLHDGQFPQDIMMQQTDASLVDYEMDIYWVVTAGQDPVAWFKKYPQRFRLCHVKDRKKNVAATDTDASCILGEGSIDYPTIVKAARKQGMRYYIVEQERYDAATPLESVKKGAAYMKTLKL
jgi:sugar phosphate isomerase/epimerase